MEGAKILSSPSHFGRGLGGRVIKKPPAPALPRKGEGENAKGS